MKLISFNYAQDSQTVLTSSSEHYNYPLSNIKNDFRAKEWRSSGNFDIDSSNKNVIIEEYTGLTLDNTENFNMDEGNFSPIELKVSLQSKLDLLCSYDYKVYLIENNTKIKIESLTSGKSFKVSGSFITLYEIPNTKGTLVQSSKNVLHTSENIVFDLLTTEEIDTFAILWGKGQYKLSPTATLTLQGSASPSFTGLGVFETVVSFDNKNEIAQAHFETKSLRYWRLKIIDKNNINCYVNIGTIILGYSHQILNTTSNGFSFAMKDKSKIYETDFGQKYIDKYPKIKELSLKFDVMELDETESIIEMFENIGITDSIFITLDPTEQVLSKDNYWIYGKLVEGISLNHQIRDIFNTGIKIEESN